MEIIESVVNSTLLPVPSGGFVFFVQDEKIAKNIRRIKKPLFIYRVDY
jgi:hypothetical protein